MADGEIELYGALRSKTGEGKVAFASEIYDEEQRKFQSDINKETANDGLVSAKTQQSFSVTEKEQARSNIGAGTYTKPSSGIPKNDMSQEIGDKLDKIVPATQLTAGLIQPKHQGSTNQSGLLIVGTDGSLQVNTRQDLGLYIDGAGQLHSNIIGSASENEIDAKTSTSKAITPNNIDYAIENNATVSDTAVYINTIDPMIPAAASAQNQLADKAFVNNLIGTIPSGGGTVYVEKYNKASLYIALTSALADQTSDYCVYDCSYFTGNATFDDTIYINKPCTILFGNITIETHGANFFEIGSDNVQIIGYNRTTDRGQTDIKNATTLVMSSYSINNDSDKGYHIYSKGNKNLRFEYMTLKGIRTTLGRQCGNADYPIDGCGGIHIDKGNPAVTFSGNTCNNVVINQLLIDGTKTHGIYISTPILSTITNTRMSYIAGHGIFLNSATSVSITNVYVASAGLAGFCLLGCNYCNLNNCVSEISGTGFLLRGSFNISLFSPGTEETVNRGVNPWTNSYSVTNKYGFNVTATGYEYNSETQKYDIPVTITISDVNSDLLNAFSGTPYTIVGGRGISLYTPYSIGIATAPSPQYSDQATYLIETTALMRIRGNARKIFVNNLQGANLNGANVLYNDIKIESNSEGSPNGVEIVYDVTNPLIQSQFDKYITQYANDFAPIYIVPTARNVVVRNGGTFYTPITFDDGAIISNLSINQLIANIIKVNNIKIDAENNTIQIVKPEETQVPTQIALEQGYIGGSGTPQSDQPERIRTADFILWNENFDYRGVFVDSNGNTVTSGRMRLSRYSSDKSFLGNNDFNPADFTNIKVINDYMQEGQYFKLTFYKSGNTFVAGSSSFETLLTEIADVPKVTLDANGNGTFAGNIHALNIP